MRSFKNTYTSIKNTINSNAFLEKHRLSKTDFTRNRKLPFPLLLSYFLNLNKGACQRELDNFFAVLHQQRPTEQFITKSAFTQARKKLSHSAFIDLNKIAVDSFYENSQDYFKWKGFRLCAMDGSQLRLPNEADIINTFGVHEGRESQKDCPMALASICYDVLNNVVIDASINPPHASERALAYEHLLQAQANDLRLYDRGYPAFWLFAAHQKQNQSFCMRVKSNLEKIYRDFKRSGKKETLFTLKPNKKSIAQCKEKNLSINPITLRLIRVDLTSETEILVTNILDNEIICADKFKELYHLRWGVEESYKRQKQWVEIENFSGKTAQSVKQDFFSKLVTLNLTAITLSASQAIVKKKTSMRKLQYKVNFAQALSKIKDNIIVLLHHAKWQEHLIALIKYCSQTIEAVRKGRTFIRRKSKLKNNIKHLCYKGCR